MTSITEADVESAAMDLEVTVDSLLWRRHRARQGQPVIGAILTHLRLRRL